MPRMSVNINKESADALRKICQAKGISYTEAVRRAVAVFDLVYEEDKKGTVIKVGGKEFKLL